MVFFVLMNVERWKADAELVAANIPSDSPIIDRVHYLLDQVFARGKVVDHEHFTQLLPLDSPGLGFVITDRDLLRRSPTKLGAMARQLSGVAFVGHGPNVPSVMAIPKHNPYTPFGNGHILLHELEHITEPEAGLTGNSTLGQRERRAYATNIAILRSIDGSDFEKYLDNWLVAYTEYIGSTNTAADIKFQEEDCPEPPKETFTHALWDEGDISRRMLLSVGRMGVMENLTTNLSEH